MKNVTSNEIKRFKRKTIITLKENNSTPKQIFLMIHYCNLFIIFIKFYSNFLFRTIEKFFLLQKLKIVQKHSENKHMY